MISGNFRVFVGAQPNWLGTFFYITTRKFDSVNVDAESSYQTAFFVFLGKFYNFISQNYLPRMGCFIQDD